MKARITAETVSFSCAHLALVLGLLQASKAVEDGFAFIVLTTREAGSSLVPVRCGEVE